MNANLKKWLKRVVYITVILLAIYFLEGYGVLGLLLFFLVWFSYRLYTRRDFFMFNLRQIETRIWGKPLDKEAWDDDELKNTKVKIVWRKKKDESAKT